MDVLVCGSRLLAEKTKVFDVLDTLAGRIEISQILYQTGVEADEIACEWADHRNIPARITTWANRKTDAASGERQMHVSSKPDLVLAFPGEEDLVLQAKVVGLTVIEIDRDQAGSQLRSKAVALSTATSFRTPR